MIKRSRGKSLTWTQALITRSMIKLNNQDHDGDNQKLRGGFCLLSNIYGDDDEYDYQSIEP